MTGGRRGNRKLACRESAMPRNARMARRGDVQCTVLTKRMIVEARQIMPARQASCFSSDKAAAALAKLQHVLDTITQFRTMNAYTRRQGHRGSS